MTRSPKVLVQCAGCGRRSLLLRNLFGTEWRPLRTEDLKVNRRVLQCAANRSVGRLMGRLQYPLQACCEYPCARAGRRRRAASARGCGIEHACPLQHASQR